MTNNKNNLIGSIYKLRSLPNIHMWPGELALSCNPSYLGGKNCGMVCGKMIARTAYRKLALIQGLEEPETEPTPEPIQPDPVLIMYY